MRDTDLYGKILGVESPWRVTGVDLRLDEGRVEVWVEHHGELSCPECGARAGRHDTRLRRWRHLDTCQFQTILAVSVPRVRCCEHGVKTVGVPWDAGSSFTALFEALIIDWLLAAKNLSAVARCLGLTWDEVDGVMQRAVARGLARRVPALPAAIGVDETSFQRRHEYVTVVADLRRGRQGVVHHVAEGRGQEALASYYAGFERQHLQGLETIAMDMWAPYIAATRAAIPEADEKIAFDKFHVAQHLGDAVDRVRREEHRTLQAEGDTTLCKTRYLWLTHPANLPAESSKRLADLSRKLLKTSRAWRLKELAMEIWAAESAEDAEEIFAAWYGWASRSRLEPMRRVARTLKKHWQGVLNAIRRGVTNARMEGINSVIQGLKRSARGFRNRDRFRNAIYFHLGGLQLYPVAVTHLKA